MIKGNLFSSYYSQLENQLTEAFLKVFMYSTPELTSRLLSFFGIEGEYGDYRYDFQFGNYIQMNIKQAVLVGIAESKELMSYPAQTEEEEETEAEKEGVPDGYLYAYKGSLALLFEMKRGAGRLYQSQMDAHKRRFTGIAKVQVKEVLLSWKEVLNFFKEQQTYYLPEHRNYLLVQAFISFCEIHFVGEIMTCVSPERVITRYDTNGYLTALHNFAVDLSENQGKSMRDSIDYNAGKPAFFTIWYARGFLVLKPKGMAGLILDLLVAKLFGRNCFTSFDNKPQETFIRIDWIQTPEQFEGVKEMIRLAYKSKIKNQIFQTKQFITTHAITHEHFKHARLGREDLSFFGNKTSKVESLREEVLLALEY